MKVDRSKLILPIQTNASVTSECWTYHKLSVIETVSTSEAWISSHLEIYFDQNFNLYFGKYDDIFHLDFFSDILNYEEIPIEEASPDSIIDLLINEISKGNYIVTYLPHPIWTIHETVLYGFDCEKKLLYFNDLVDGKFKKTYMFFDDFIAAYTKTFEYFKNHDFSRIIVSWYFFPITRLSIKDYSDDLCLLKAIKNLSNISKILKIDFSEIDNNGKSISKCTHYSGMGCYIGYEYRLNEYIRDQSFIKGDIFDDLSQQIVSTLFKFYEYQKIIIKSTKWISKELNSEKYLCSQIQILEELTLKMNKLYLMGIKFKETQNWDYFYQIYAEFKLIFAPLKDVIESFCNIAEGILYKKGSLLLRE